MTALRGSLPRGGSRQAPVVAAALAAAALVGVLLAHKVALGIAALVALCFLPVAFANMALATAAWVMVAFLGGFPGMASVPNRLLLLVGVCWLGVSAARRRRGEPVFASGRAMLVLLALFAVWQAVTLLWAPVTSDGTPYVKAFLYVMLGFAVVLSTVVEPRHARWVALAFILGAVLSVLWGIAEGGLSSSTASAAASTAEDRFQGGAGDPNYLASIIVPAIVLAGGLSARRARGLRFALGAAVVVLVIGLVATQSRGGLLAAAVTALVALVICRGQRTAIVSLIAVVAVVAVGWFAVNPAAWHRVMTGGSDSGSGNGRTDVWHVAWRITEDHPIAGVGLGQFPNVSPQFVRQPGTLNYVELLVDKRIVVHNLYLQLWVENGIVGLALFLALAAGSVAAARRAIARFDALEDREMAALARATLLALVAMLTAAFFLSDLDDRRLWILLAFAPALAVMARRQAARSSPA